MSGTGGSLSHSDDEVDRMGLDNVWEEDELDLSELKKENKASEGSDELIAQRESTVVSGSSQGENSCTE